MASRTPSGTGVPQQDIPAWLAMRSRAAIYALITLLVIAAFLVRAFAAPTLGHQSLYLFLAPPLLIAGAIGGLWPGLYATALSVMLHLYGTGELSNLADTGSPE